jgi:hypothetical protein
MKTQDDVLAWEKADPAFYSPEELGNKLRETCSDLKSELDGSMTSQITPVREALTQIIGMDDRELLSHRGRPLPLVSRS